MMQMKQVSYNFYLQHISLYSDYWRALNTAIPQEEYFAGAKKAHFYGTTLKDPLCIAHIMKFQTMNANQFAKIIDFDSDHWVPLAQPQKLNEELLAWIKSDVENNWKCLNYGVTSFYPVRLSSCLGNYSKPCWSILMSTIKTCTCISWI